MIIGHVGVALGARALRRDAPWLLLGVAALLPDVVDGLIAVTPWCNPFGLYSHGLLAILVLALTLGLFALAVPLSLGTALLLGAVVLSHVVLDLVTGQKLLWWHGPLAGLELYRWPMRDFIAEVAVVAAGWHALRRAGTGPSWVARKECLLVLVLFQLGMNSTMLLQDPQPVSPCEARGLRDG